MAKTGEGTMEFATKNLDGNGMAALALVVSLVQVLAEKRLLTPADTKEVIDRAFGLLPQDLGNLAVQARGLVASLREA
jgi:hypothetical protein